MRIEDMDIDKPGPCMVPGHSKFHKLAMNPCWTTMRRYLLEHTWEQFLEQVEKKK